MQNHILRICKPSTQKITVNLEIVVEVIDQESWANPKLAFCGYLKPIMDAKTKVGLPDKNDVLAEEFHSP